MFNHNHVRKSIEVIMKLQISIAVRIVFKCIFNSSLKKLKWGFHIVTFMDMKLSNIKN